jgi:hypothetical protein
MINPAILTERLSRLIGEFASAAMESRQVAKRLADLLPSRLAELKREHGRRGADAERLALTDPRYLQAIEELGDVSGKAAQARINYETHAMLYKARQSLRAHRR